MMGDGPVVVAGQTEIAHAFSPERCENLIGRWRSAAAESNLAVDVDQVHGSLYERPIGVIQLGESLPLVHQQRKRQFLFLAKIGMTASALRVNAVYLYVVRFQPIPIVTHLAKLLRATGSIVAR